MTEIVGTENPQEMPDWKMRLEWMIERQPSLTLELLAKGELMNVLLRYLTQASFLRLKLMEKGKDRLEIDEAVAAAIAPESETGPPPPMSQSEEAKIWKWVRHLPNKVWEIEYNGPFPTS